MSHNAAFVGMFPPAKPREGGLTWEWQEVWIPCQAFSWRAAVGVAAGSGATQFGSAVDLYPQIIGSNTGHITGVVSETSGEAVSWTWALPGNADPHGNLYVQLVYCIQGAAADVVDPDSGFAHFSLTYLTMNHGTPISGTAGAGVALATADSNWAQQNFSGQLVVSGIYPVCHTEWAIISGHVSGLDTQAGLRFRPGESIINFIATNKATAPGALQKAANGVAIMGAKILYQRGLL